MALDLLTGKQSKKDFSCGAAFATEARSAVEKAPGYFVWWYTAKSIGLGVAVAAVGYLLGREAGAKSQRARGEMMRRLRGGA